MKLRRRPHDESATDVTTAPAVTARALSGWPLIFGIGAVVALVVMVVLVWRGPSSGHSGVDALDRDALTLGVQDDQLASAPVSDLTGRLDRIAATGVTVTRVEVAWADVASSKPADARNPDDPAYSWQRTDAVFDGLRKHDIRAIVVFSASPGWANGDLGREWAPDPAAFGDFVHAFATRYRADPAEIIAYEPWNEPNNPGYLMPQWEGVGTTAAPASPTAYAELAAKARDAISGSGAALIGPSTADIASSAPGVGGVSVSDFVTALVEAKPRPHFDAVAQHLQPQSGDDVSTSRVPSLEALPKLLALYDRLASGRDLFITRISYATAPGGMTFDQQSTALQDAVAALRTERRVRLMVWGPFQDTIENPAGLITTAGAAKPALGVFTRMPKTLASDTP